MNTSGMEKHINLVENGSRNANDPLLVGSVIFGTQASFCLIANLLVVFLFVCCRHLLTNPHYRCILSLAITDIFTSISVLTCKCGLCVWRRAI